jgi:hypothetical protein
MNGRLEGGKGRRPSLVSSKPPALVPLVLVAVLAIVLLTARSDLDATPASRRMARDGVLVVVSLQES